MGEQRRVLASDRRQPVDEVRVPFAMREPDFGVGRNEERQAVPICAFLERSIPILRTNSFAALRDGLLSAFGRRTGLSLVCREVVLALHAPSFRISVTLAERNGNIDRSDNSARYHLPDRGILAGGRVVDCRMAVLWKLGVARKLH